MELKTIAVTYGRKLNLGDYNSIHSEITLWADLELEDDEVDAALALRQMARHNVMQELGRADQRLRTKTEELFLGLPVALQQTIIDGDENGSYVEDLESIEE